jgi:hypothetical protein
MERFFFHTQTNGTMAKDPIGQWFDNRIDACIDAIGTMPLKLECALDGVRNAYITTEVRNRACSLYVVRATIVIEVRDAEPHPAPAPPPESLKSKRARPLGQIDRRANLPMTTRKTPLRRIWRAPPVRFGKKHAQGGIVATGLFQLRSLIKVGSTRTRPCPGHAPASTRCRAQRSPWRAQTVGPHPSMTSRG